MRTPSTVHRSGHRALLGGLVASLLIGLGCYHIIDRLIESDARQRFNNHARQAQSTINARIKSYTDVLRASASLFRSSDLVSRVDFHRFVDNLDLEHNFPALETINYAFYFRDADRAEFERRILEEERRTPTGEPLIRISPPGKRAAYSVITYIEPRRLWDGGYGFDMQSNPYVANALMESRDNNSLQASGTAIAAISGPNRIALGMRLPVYRAGMPIASLEQRRAAYIGSVGIAFSIPKLVQGVLAEMPAQHVRMTLVDGGVPRPGRVRLEAPVVRVLYDSAGSDADPVPAQELGPTRFVSTLPVEFKGRPWSVTFSTDKKNLYTEYDTVYPKLALLAGFVVSLAIFALLYTLTSSRRHALALAREMTRELRDSEGRLQASHDKLRRLAAHADHIKENERKRIAREIHDDLGQNLLALRIDVEMLASRTAHHHPRLHMRACVTLEQIDQTIKSVRQIINDLRPNVLDLGLSAAVEWQISEFVKRTGIKCTLIDHGQEIKVSDNCATALFRILQESLSNVVRHAAATEVTVTLEQQEKRVWMWVSDNGVGLRSGARNRHSSYGLVGIEERINMLGGSFTISSTPGNGTTVCVSAPRDTSGPPIEGLTEPVRDLLEDGALA
jgi:signal transduction histidine kinase